MSVFLRLFPRSELQEVFEFSANGKNYYVDKRLKMNFKWATKNCKKKGGNLAMDLDQEQWLDIDKVFPIYSGDYYWVGGKAETVEGVKEWKWLNGNIIEDDDPSWRDSPFFEGNCLMIHSDHNSDYSKKICMNDGGCEGKFMFMCQLN